VFLMGLFVESNYPYIEFWEVQPLLLTIFKWLVRTVKVRMKPHYMGVRAGWVAQCVGHSWGWGAFGVTLEVGQTPLFCVMTLEVGQNKGV
jgi:hypothetical protein